jgi:hypothetical protein
MTRKNQKPIYLERGILKSEAFLSLKKTKSAPIYLHFLAKRQMGHVGRGGKKKWKITNNGEIIFPFSEARKLGYSNKQFDDALRELVEHGFIDIAEPGGYYDGHPSKYAISERWRDFGKPGFEIITKPKDNRKSRGFAAAIKKYGRYGFQLIQKNDPYGAEMLEKAEKGELFIRPRDPNRKRKK